MDLSHGVESWALAGAMEVESWSEFWSGIYIRGQELVLIHQFLVNAYFYEAISFYSVCFFCHVSLTYVNQDLNICFIINRQV